MVSTTANQITNGPNTPWVSKGLWGSQRWGFVAFKSSVDINVTPKLATLEGLWPNKCYPMGHLRNILQYTWPSNMIECYITVVMLFRKTLKDLKRKLDPEEALCTHLLPTTSKAARVAGAPKINLEGISPRDQTVMAGNAMNVPCVAAFILSMVMCLERRTDG